MKKLFLFFSFIIIFYGCENSTGPNNSESPKLILSANKTIGNAPLLVNFSGKIEGNTAGLTGHVPDYIFFSQIGMIVIPYIIPDTSQALKNNWSTEKTYSTGEYKVVLLYQGIKNGKSINLLSDTLLIRVN